MLLKIVNTNSSCIAKSRHQSGVALIQVLLITVVISLLALTFTKTARDQVLMASQFDGRARTQLKAYSVKNRTIFLLLSDRIEALGSDDNALNEARGLKQQINYHGDPVSLGGNTFVTIQDLNGLLPQRHPENIFWPKLLKGFNWSDTKVEETMGIWTDFQDPNIDSCITGIKEPEALANGQIYLDGLAQNDRPIYWIFKDDHVERDAILRVSDINAPFNLNVLNMPSGLLVRLFDTVTSQAISESRKLRNSAVNSLIPDIRGEETVFVHNSGRLRLSIGMQDKGIKWKESITLYLTHLMDPPFNVLEIKE